MRTWGNRVNGGNHFFSFASITYDTFRLVSSEEDPGMATTLITAGIANALLSNAELTGEKITAAALIGAMRQDAATGTPAVARGTAKDLKLVAAARLDPDGPLHEPVVETLEALRERAETDMKGDREFLNTLRSVCDTIAKHCPECWLKRVATSAIQSIDSVIEEQVQQATSYLSSSLPPQQVQEKPDEVVAMLDGKGDNLRKELDRANQSRAARRWRQLVDGAMFGGSDALEESAAFAASVANSAVGVEDVATIKKVRAVVSLISTISIASDARSIASAITLVEHAIHQLGTVDWGTPGLASVRNALYASAAKLADLADDRVDDAKILAA
jgi:hypothetical protein